MASTLLIRHAQASFGAEDYDRLSELGCLQAEFTAEYLAATAGPIVHVICGSHKRQQVTAEHIADKVRNSAGCRPNFAIDSRLDELDIDTCIARIAPQINDAD